MAGNPVLVRLRSKLDTMDWSNLAQRGRLLAHSTTQKSIKAFECARTIVKGPVRNGVLIGREFLSFLRTERQWPQHLPSRTLWRQAQQEYLQLAQHLRSVLSTRESITRWLQSTSWSAVGNSLLIAGEILSAYYVAKLLGRTVRGTGRLIFSPKPS